MSDSAELAALRARLVALERRVEEIESDRARSREERAHSVRCRCGACMSERARIWTGYR